MDLKRIRLIGIGEDGLSGLSPVAREAVLTAHILVGGERHLEFFPDHPGKKELLKSNPAKTLDHILESADGDQSIAILASGDPFFYGVGNLLAKKAGRDSLFCVPSVSSIQLLFSKIGTKWDDAKIISVHGRQMNGLVTRLRGARKAGLILDPSNSPQQVAERLIEFHSADWTAFIGENLGGESERVSSFPLEDLVREKEFSPLAVMALFRKDPDFQSPPVIPFIPDDLFTKRIPKKGLITKREVRLVSLGFLRPSGSGVLWDIGAGSGSVAIEAGLIMEEGSVYAIEKDVESVEIIRENVRVHGADNVVVVAGRAPDGMDEWPEPDSIFVGGTGGGMENVLAYSYRRLKMGGRLVVNGITMENVFECYQFMKGLGKNLEIDLVQVSRGEPLAGKYFRYEALNPIHIFCIQKSEGESHAG